METAGWFLNLKLFQINNNCMRNVEENMWMWQCNFQAELLQHVAWAGSSMGPKAV